MAQFKDKVVIVTGRLDILNELSISHIIIILMKATSYFYIPHQKITLYGVWNRWRRASMHTMFMLTIGALDLTLDIRF